MSLTGIPYFMMRGGSSRGPYFNAKDLPNDREQIARILISAVGAGHPLNIDGIGGGNAVTTKVAILSKSDSDWADIDYLFAQVSVLEHTVDFKPTCGNILSGVGAAAIEMGLVTPNAGITEIKIHAVNTGANIICRLQTPHRAITYAGQTSIDGIPGTAAPVELSFLDVAGSSTGAFLPTKQLINTIDGYEVTCMDVAMPVVIARASDFGLTGQETAEQLDTNRDFFTTMEAIRLKAAVLMGMGDCRQSVTPKFAILSPVAKENTIRARYFMPWATHPTMAVTASQCIASCALTTGTVADGMMKTGQNTPVTVTIEHPMGSMDVIVDYALDDNGLFSLKSAGLVRTCRKLAAGEVFIPDSIWSKPSFEQGTE